MADNASTELGMRDPRMVEVAERYRSTLREGIRRPLAWSAERGEVEPTLVDAYTESLVSSMFGMSVSARSGAGAEELERLLDSMLLLIKSWKKA